LEVGSLGGLNATDAVLALGFNPREEVNWLRRTGAFAELVEERIYERILVEGAVVALRALQSLGDGGLLRLRFFLLWLRRFGWLLSLSNTTLANEAGSVGLFVGG